MTTLLEVTNVSKNFSGLRAVADVSFAVPEGSVFAVIGPNGAGKTTLFNLIAGMMAPDEGSIVFQGARIDRLPPNDICRRGIGRTFQIVRPFRALTTLENVLAVIPSRTAERAARSPLALLQEVGLGNRAHDLAGELTLGMLKRLEVARALALDPRLLLLDEPLAGLTTRESQDLLSFIASLRHRISIIMVEHNVRLALPVCDRAVVLDSGAIIAEGTPEQIRQNPDVIRAYLGQDAG
jgi:ABC-type branched-subunit amino acid transport system ATPase component